MKSHLLGDGAGSERVVARHHHDAHAGVVDRLDDRAGIVAHRVFEADQAGEPQLTCLAGRYAEHALAARGQFLFLRQPRQFRHAAKLGDDSGGALGVTMHTVRLLIRCFGAFRRWVKRLELDARGAFARRDKLRVRQ